MIIGIGVDVVAVSRLSAALGRSPTLGKRLFTELERQQRLESLAGCFAAKEAVLKALGGLRPPPWLEIEVLHEAGGRPLLQLSGRAEAGACAAGVVTWHVSISHDADIATAFVIAEGDAR